MSILLNHYQRFHHYCGHTLRALNELQITLTKPSFFHFCCFYLYKCTYTQSFIIDAVIKILTQDRCIQYILKNTMVFEQINKVKVKEPFILKTYSLETIFSSRLQVIFFFFFFFSFLNFLSLLTYYTIHQLSKHSKWWAIQTKSTPALQNRSFYRQTEFKKSCRNKNICMLLKTLSSCYGYQSRPLLVKMGADCVYESHLDCTITSSTLCRGNEPNSMKEKIGLRSFLQSTLKPKITITWVDHDNMTTI